MQEDEPRLSANGDATRVIYSGGDWSPNICEKKVSEMNSDSESEIDSDAQGVSERIDRLEDLIKEREISFLRAMKTFATDFTDYQSGRRDVFPRAALLGAIFAYLRPRLVLTFAGLFAAIFAGAQVYLLNTQNELIAIQSNLISSQVGANRAEAIASIMAQLDPSSKISRNTTIPQLAAYGGQGFDSLLEIARYNDDYVGHVARAALISTIDIQTDGELRRVGQMYYLAISSTINELRNSIEKSDDNIYKNFENFAVTVYDFNSFNFALDDAGRSHSYFPESYFEWQSLMTIFSYWAEVNKYVYEMRGDWPDKEYYTDPEFVGRFSMGNLDNHVSRDCYRWAGAPVTAEKAIINVREVFVEELPNSDGLILIGPPAQLNRVRALLVELCSK